MPTTEVAGGLDYLSKVDQMKAIGAFQTLYGPKPVVREYRARCHCPACRRERGEPPETSPQSDWSVWPGCGKRHPPQG